MITTPFDILEPNGLIFENKIEPERNFFSRYKSIKEKSVFEVKEIPLRELENWKYEDGKYCHESGKFFKIEGIRVKTNYGSTHTWDQPIMDQPEIGILGILTKVIDGTRYYLMQLKMEPGNVNKLQISPTVQATKSNFMKVHKGKSTKFLEYFAIKGKSKILIDQLQSEQGARFLKKRNRNMIVEITDDIEIPENYVWLTLGQLKALIIHNNFINMDARSVISTIPYSKSKYGESPINSDEDIIRWYIDKKMEYELSIENFPLHDLRDWSINSNTISNSSRFFNVIGVKTITDNREIASWSQPMFKDTNISLIGLIRKCFNEEDHFLFQAKVMPGNIDIIDLSPTVSISNYKYVNNPYNDVNVRFLDKFIDYNNEKTQNVFYDTIQSEEGGRFYQFQTRNMIADVEEDIQVPDNFIWLSRSQITKFMPYGLFNVESRSLLAVLQ